MITIPIARSLYVASGRLLSTAEGKTLSPFAFHGR
jgi:hypothetical protein